MNVTAEILSKIPDTHRDALLDEYQSILSNFLEHRWLPAEVCGGRFCEIVYSILLGLGTGSFSSKPTKPKNMEVDCKRLESLTILSRSFRILIPRLLPALYEVRNNRGAGHVGGDVDSNHMDATFVVAAVNWIMAELVRELHTVEIDEAQRIVDSFAERRTPLIWSDGQIKRVLHGKITVSDKILLLLFSCSSNPTESDLLEWIEYKNKARFRQILKGLHAKRYIESAVINKPIILLPPGTAHVEKLIGKLAVA